MADERERFEAWARQFHYDLTRLGPSYVNEPYANEFTDWSWLAWQAALGGTSLRNDAEKLKEKPLKSTA